MGVNVGVGMLVRNRDEVDGGVGVVRDVRMGG